MASSARFLALTDLRGGRNGKDPPLSIGDTQVVEAFNVDYEDGLLGRKRAGTSALSLTFSSGGPFTAAIFAMHRHVPSNDETLAELWAVDNSSPPVVGRLAAATTWTAPTLKDNIATATYDVVMASFNNKLFFAYDSAVDRLHVWDGTTVRRVGMATSGAPSVAAMGAGGLSFTRYYRQRYLQLATLRRSEASSVASITVSSKLGVTVTKAAAVNEGETHWEVEAADSATGPWYVLAQTVVGTTTYDDTNATIPTTTASDVAGTYTIPTSFRYLLVDGNRLLGAGAWETTNAKYSRVWFTPVLGDKDAGDDERIVNSTTQKNWIDLDENDGGFITGLGGPILGGVYVFKTRQIWKLIRTGIVSAPYQAIPISKTVGCVRHHTIRIGEDAEGNPALYFASWDGPYRLGLNGLEYLGWRVADRWAAFGPEATVPAFSEYYPALRQWWLYFALSGASFPGEKLVYHVRTGAWARHPVTSTQTVACSALFSGTVGATMTRDLKPYVGAAGSAAIWKTDTGTQDAGANYQAYIKTKPYALVGLGRNARTQEVSLLAKTQSGVTLTLSLIRDFGLETRTSTVSLTAAASETRKQVRIEGSELAQAGVVELQIGDAAAANTTWTLDGLVVPIFEEQAR